MFRLMTTFTALALTSLLVVACNAATVANCQGSGPGSITEACNTCLTTKCEAQVSAVDSDCGDVSACIEACSCSDQPCLDGCTAKADATCKPALSNIAACQTTTCATECAP